VKWLIDLVNQALLDNKADVAITESQYKVLWYDLVNSDSETAEFLLDSLVASKEKLEVPVAIAQHMAEYLSQEEDS